MRSNKTIDEFTGYDKSGRFSGRSMVRKPNVYGFLSVLCLKPKLKTTNVAGQRGTRQGGKTHTWEHGTRTLSQTRSVEKDAFQRSLDLWQ